MGGILCYLNKDWCDTKESSQRSSTRKRSPHHLPNHLPPRQPSPSRLQKQLEHAFPALGIRIMTSPTSPTHSPNTSPVMLPPAVPYINKIHNRITLKRRSHRKSPSPKKTGARNIKEAAAKAYGYY